MTTSQCWSVYVGVCAAVIVFLWNAVDPPRWVGDAGTPPPTFFDPLNPPAAPVHYQTPWGLSVRIEDVAVSLLAGVLAFLLATAVTAGWRYLGHLDMAHEHGRIGTEPGASGSASQAASPPPEAARASRLRVKRATWLAVAIAVGALAAVVVAVDSVNRLGGFSVLDVGITFLFWFAAVGLVWRAAQFVTARTRSDQDDR